MVSIITLMLLGYLAIGLLVGIGFVLRGVNRVDPVAADSPWFFRLVILPGCVGLWPVVLRMWFKSGRPGQGGAA